MSDSFDDTINADRTLRGLQKGRRLAGRYELVRLLGQGGMGVVWLARDLAMQGDEVAIKALPEFVARDPDAIDQLIEEARVAMRLSHPGIMRLHNLDQSESGLPFLVMEYLPGPTLKEVLRERRQARASGPYLNDQEFQRFHAQVTEALKHAHKQNVVHRDLKPGNLMFSRSIDDASRPIDFDEVKVKICDFGIARTLEDCRTNRTGTPSPGTPRYMSPEQIRGKDIGPASDYYSLGCILYECLAGQPPFTTGNLTHQHLHEPPEPIPGILGDAEELVFRCLEKDPQARLAERRGSSPRARPAPEPRKKPDGRQPRSKRLGLGLGLAAVALLIPALALYGVWRSYPNQGDRIRGKRNFAEAVPPDRSSAPASIGEESSQSRASGKPERTPGAMSIAPPAPTPRPEARATDYTETVNGIDLEMVWIEGGSFLMGSPPGEAGRDDDEGPQHRVELDGFWLGKFEVTNAQFEEFVSQTGYRTEAEKEGYGYAFDGSTWQWKKGASWRHLRGPGSSTSVKPEHPVVLVSWNDAKAFCDWLSKETGLYYTLPTEAQWEYACRAVTRTAFHWGNYPEGGEGWANVGDKTARERGFPFTVFPFRTGHLRTSPVGAFRSNGWGLHDLHGNVWEWCLDKYASNYYEKSERKNPAGPPRGDHVSYEYGGKDWAGEARVLRGGSWFNIPANVRAACRYRNVPEERSDNIGFRVARIAD